MLFFKTDLMQYYREINIEGEQGLYRFKYDPKIYPGTSIQYYFVIKSNTQLFATPVSSKGKLYPMDSQFIDPIEYHKQKVRLKK